MSSRLGPSLVKKWPTDPSYGNSDISARKDATIYRMLGEEIRSGAFFPGSEASVLTPQGKSCSLLSGHLLVLSASSASAILRRFPQPVHVAHGWDAEEAFVLPIEVGGVVVAHAIGRTGRVQVFAQH